jgi:D-alanyl-D-alanine carboxypeptidase
MMNILKFVSTSLLLFVALTGVAQAKEGAVAAKEAAVAAKESVVAAKEGALAAKEVAAKEKQFSSEIQKKLQTRMESLVKEINAPGFNVGIWIPGEGEWQNSFGVANKETAEKMSLDKHFRIGSITKTFVITAILQLVDKGDISLDDKISKYIDNELIACFVFKISRSFCYAT